VGAGTSRRSDTPGCGLPARRPVRAWREGHHLRAGARPAEAPRAGAEGREANCLGSRTYPWVLDSGQDDRMTKLSVRSTGRGSSGSVLSLWSQDSVLSIGSVGSVLSVGSVGSALSAGSIGSALSAGSIGSALSLISTGSWLSTGSLFSAQSRWSVLSWRSSGAFLAVGTAAGGALLLAQALHRTGTGGGAGAGTG